MILRFLTGPKTAAKGFINDLFALNCYYILQIAKSVWMIFLLNSFKMSPKKIFKWSKIFGFAA